MSVIFAGHLPVDSAHVSRKDSSISLESGFVNFATKIWLANEDISYSMKTHVDFESIPSRQLPRHSQLILDGNSWTYCTVQVCPTNVVRSRFLPSYPEARREASCIPKLTSDTNCWKLKFCSWLTASIYSGGSIIRGPTSVIRLNGPENWAKVNAVSWSCGSLLVQIPFQILERWASLPGSWTALCPESMSIEICHNWYTGDWKIFGRKRMPNSRGQSPQLEMPRRHERSPELMHQWRNRLDVGWNWLKSLWMCNDFFEPEGTTATVITSMDNGIFLHKLHFLAQTAQVAQFLDGTSHVQAWLMQTATSTWGCSDFEKTYDQNGKGGWTDSHPMIDGDTGIMYAVICQNVDCRWVNTTRCQARWELSNQAALRTRRSAWIDKVPPANSCSSKTSGHIGVESRRFWLRRSPMPKSIICISLVIS